MQWYQKYRPRKLADIVGQDQAVKTVESLFARKAGFPKAVIFTGPYGCLRGDMTIHDPVAETNLTVKERWTLGVPFHVYAMNERTGEPVVTLAMPPVRYEEVPMFRVTTGVGSFVVTGDHRILTSSGYERVRSLAERLSVGEVRLPTSSEPDLSVRTAGGPRSMRTVQGSQVGYPHEHRSYGERLRRGKAVSLVTAPSQGDVLEHTQSVVRACEPHTDGQDTTLGCSRPYPPAVPPSTQGSCPPDRPPDDAEEFLIASVNQEPGSGSFGTSQPVGCSSSLSCKGERPQRHVQESTLDVCVGSDQSASEFSASVVHGGTECTIIVSIEPAGSNVYYDFHVPVHNNYWMEGVFHHNCGKSALAAVVAHKLGCRGNDLEVVNCATTDPMDKVREIESLMHVGGLQGPCRVWILEECFPSGTMVDTESGPRRIEDILPGDRVNNVVGFGTVEDTFRNYVRLDRVVRLDLSDNTVLFTTESHKILTETGWKEARDLTKSDVILYNISQRQPLEGQNGRTQDSQVRLLSGEIQAEGSKTEVLFDFLPVSNASTPGRRELPDLWEGVLKQTVTRADGVQQVVCGQNDVVGASGDEGDASVPGEAESLETGVRVVPTNSCRKGVGGQKHTTDDRNLTIPGTRLQGEDARRFGLQSSNAETPKTDAYEQPEQGPGSHCQDESHEGEERDSPQVAGYAPQPEHYSARAESFRSAGRGEERLETGSCDLHRAPPEVPVGVSGRLPTGCVSSGTETGSGGRWERTQAEQAYVARCQADPQTRRTRVVGVQSYERGRNDAAFAGVITDQDRLRGFVVFHDLQVSDHPSFFAGGIPVHNCQSLSRATFAQQGLLRVLEDETNRSSYFLLTTTDPGKVLPAVLSRCTKIELKPIKPVDLHILAGRALRLEEVECKAEIIKTVIDNANGSARQMLVDLERVVGLPEGSQDTEGGAEKAGIDLSRALLAGSKWPAVAAILKALSEDPEKVRRGVLGYANSVLLGGGAKAGQAALMIEAFSEPYYDVGKVGLTKSCWDVAGTGR